MQKHAFAAGMGAPVRLCPDDHPNPVGDLQGLSDQKKTAGHQSGTTAAIESQHPDSATPKQLAPVAGGRHHD